MTAIQIIPYLPYNLKLQVNGHRRTLSGVKISKEGSLVVNYDFMVWEVMNKSIKPVLRPLSDLVKEIDIRGKKFIPLVELKKSGTDLNELRFKEYENCFSVIDNGEHELCLYLDTKSFHKYYRGEDRSNINQIELHNKLLEWHFDIYGLIEEGEAIDINTINR